MIDTLMQLQEQGMQHAAHGEHLEAIRVFTRVIEASPFWLAPYIHWKRGESYAALGRYEEAIADYEVPHCDDVGVEEEPRRRWRLACLLQEHGQPERATRVLQDLVDYCTGWIELIVTRGGYPWMCYYERARARAGLKDFVAAKSDCALASKAIAKARTRTPTFLQTYWKHWWPDEADISKLLKSILAETTPR